MHEQGRQFPAGRRPMNDIQERPRLSPDLEGDTLPPGVELQPGKRERLHRTERADTQVTAGQSGILVRRMAAMPPGFQAVKRI
jgi:hypothetical protein